jgi:hypothetical protein
MNATEIAAWWGAIIATLVFAWDIFKWNRSGPIINVLASPNMKIFGDIPEHPEDMTYVAVEVTNTGDKKTTITHLVGFHYKSIFQKLRRKNNKSFAVVNPAFNARLPHVLEPGERWLGGIEQNEELEEFSRNGYLHCGVIHSSGKYPVTQRVIVHNENNAT